MVIFPTVRYILLFTWNFSDCIAVFLTAYILHLKVAFISAFQSQNLKTNQAYVCKICAYFNCCIKCKYMSCILHNLHSLTNTTVIYQLPRIKNFEPLFKNKNLYQHTCLGDHLHFNSKKM